MSSPIDIPDAGLASPSWSSPDSMLSPGLYIPVHKRTGSSRSSSGLTSLPDTEHITPNSRVYNTEFLLTLRPNAIESMKERIRVSCPEVVMSRRVRKAVEYYERQHTKNHLSNPVSLEGEHPIVIDMHTHPGQNIPRPRPPRDASVPTQAEGWRHAPRSFSTSGASRTWRGMNVSSLTPLRLTLG